MNEKLLLSYATGDNNYFRFNWLEVVPGVYGEFTHNTEKWGVIAESEEIIVFYKKLFCNTQASFKTELNNETALKLMAGSGRRTPYAHGKYELYDHL